MLRMIRPPIAAAEVSALVMSIFAADLHVRRCESLANAVLGLMHADSLSIHELGRGMARARGTQAKHGIKQVDRLLGNEGLALDVAFGAWVRWVVDRRTEIVVAIDWTEYGDDRHSRVALNLITEHGRATPLIWKTVLTVDLKNRRSEYEADVLQQLREILPSSVRVTVLGDRAFGDTSLYELCDRVLKFDYVFRFRECIRVQNDAGCNAKARDWIAADGSAQRYDDVRVTHSHYRVRGVVTVHDTKMKEAWCLATSRPDDAAAIVSLYGRRFTIEETFRDEKDGHFGMGVLNTHIGAPTRRDRLLLIMAVASAILTMVGHAGESTGAYRSLKANTSPRRQHSLFAQGREYMRGLHANRYDDLRAELARLMGDRRAATFGVI